MDTSLDNYEFEDDFSQDKPSESLDFSAPRGDLKSARLIFASRVGHLKLNTVSSTTDLYQARFQSFGPHAWIHEDQLTIEYTRSPSQLINLRASEAQVSLNNSIPWEVEFHKGIFHLDGDLSQLQLHSLDILGGASEINLLLSEPSGTAFIYISGGVGQSEIHVPASVGIRVRVNGGSTNLKFGAQRLGSIGGETSLESPDFESATGRYHIDISGGARDLTIDQKG